MLPYCIRSQELEKWEELFTALWSSFLLLQGSSHTVYPCCDEAPLSCKGEIGRNNGRELSWKPFCFPEVLARWVVATGDSFGGSGVMVPSLHEWCCRLPHCGCLGLSISVTPLSPLLGLLWHEANSDWGCHCRYTICSQGLSRWWQPGRWSPLPEYDWIVTRSELKEDAQLAR